MREHQLFPGASNRRRPEQDGGNGTPWAWGRQPAQILGPGGLASPEVQPGVGVAADAATGGGGRSSGVAADAAGRREEPGNRWPKEVQLAEENRKRARDAPGHHPLRPLLAGALGPASRRGRRHG